MPSIWYIFENVKRGGDRKRMKIKEEEDRKEEGGREKRRDREGRKTGMKMASQSNRRFTVSEDHCIKAGKAWQHQ